MGKRKWEVEEDSLDLGVVSRENTNTNGTSKKAKRVSPITLQIIAGTYERILHGITVNISDVNRTAANDDIVQFADTFLFHAHGSAIRCLALSPRSKQDKITLASGGSDQTINLYHLSARRGNAKPGAVPSLPGSAGRKVVENPRNRELGSLQHHAASVNALTFPTRSKLLSAADDNTVAVARTRDWTILSTIKVPIPKAHGRPSGDTAPLGGTPSGVNDFAIHPSMKLMISLTRGEKCMRLWNLVTGRKAGVLNFEKALLQAVGEGKWGRGEGVRVEWNRFGEEFVVSFERGAVVFGLDSKPRGLIKPEPPSKIHQIHYLNLGTDDHLRPSILAASTEDGRIIFFSTSPALGNKEVSPGEASQVPMCPSIGQICSGTKSSESRIKDFEHLMVPATENPLTSSLLVTGSSDGLIRVWVLDILARMNQLQSLNEAANDAMDVSGKTADSNTSATAPQLGRMLGKYETGNRITCLKAFVMVQATGGEETSALATDRNGIANGSTEVMSDDSSE
ncbi:MAG: hypothetical protein Q9201_004986 [Fulgogasparrea decipioides]